MIRANLYAAEVMHLTLDKFESWIKEREREGVKKITTEELKQIIYKLRFNCDKLKIT